MPRLLKETVTTSRREVLLPHHLRPLSKPGRERAGPAGTLWGLGLSEGSWVKDYQADLK